MKNQKKTETVADAINKVFAKPLKFDLEPHKYNKLKGSMARPIISDLSVVRSWEAKMMSEAIKRPDILDYSTTYEPATLWKRLWWKIKWPLGLRIVHSDDICDCDEY